MRLLTCAPLQTNHPAFVQDSANIARQTREGHRPQPPLIKGSDSGSASGVFEDDEDEAEHAVARQANGLHKPNAKGVDARSASSSFPDSSRAGPGGLHAATIGHASASAMSRSAGRSDNGAAGGREFLSYFFGGASGMPGSAGPAAASGIGPSRGAFADPAREHKPNPMSGRTGLEGSSAAFDMKSLDKHIEAVS